MKIAIGSTNPVKITAVKNVMKKIYDNFEIIPVKVNSNVADNPLTEEETIEGAINRARDAIKKSKTDLGIGMEGGTIKKYNRHFMTGWCAVVDKEDNVMLGCSGMIELPTLVVEKIIKGKELGEAMDEVTGLKDTKKKMGSTGILTNNLTNRQKAWETGLIYAMAKMLKPKIYK